MKYSYSYFIVNGERLTIGQAAVKHEIICDDLAKMLPGETQEFYKGFQKVTVTRCED